MFGARFQLAPDVKLQRVVEAMQEVAELVLRMSVLRPDDPASGVEA